MAKKLFVGNIPYTSTEDDLKKLFGGIGQVESVSIITDRHSGRSKGFGFVEMSDDKEAEKAIKELNGNELEGRALVVNEARPMKPRDEKFGGGKEE
jgi:RNA recognition motif-containing protein